MVYTPETGHVNDALFRRQSADVAAGNYPVEPAPKASIGDSTTSVDIDVSAGVVRFGNEYPDVGQQTVTLPAGPEIGSGPQGGDPERVDLITIDSNGNAGRMVGEPAVPIDGNGKPTERSFPNVRQPLPRTPKPSDNVVVIAAVNVKTGINASQEMFADAVVPREVMGDGLNNLDLIPGRDLQYEIDQAREGQTLEGDRSQTILLDQPLTVNTQDLTIRNLNLKYAAGAAANNTDDMLTLAADGATVENVTIDGNKANQTVDADGITVKASNCTVRSIDGRRTAGHLININGGSTPVENTIIQGIVGRNLRKDALMIQGTGVYRVAAKSVYGFGSDAEGTVRVRNGTDWVTTNDVYGENQNRVLKVEDFGNPSDDITAFSVRNARSKGCNRLLTNDTSSSVHHTGLRLAELHGRDFTPGTRNGIINGQNFQSIKITNCALSAPYSGVYAVYVKNGSNITITNSTFKNQSADRGGISLSDCDRCFVANNTVRPSRGGPAKYGIKIQSTEGHHDFFIVTGNIFGAGLDKSVEMRETTNGGELSNFIVKNNFAPVISNNTTAASDYYIVKDNIG